MIHKTLKHDWLWLTCRAAMSHSVRTDKLLVAGSLASTPCYITFTTGTKAGFKFVFKKKKCHGGWSQSSDGHN